MPVPTNLNSDLLYPYCELSATREDGTKVDFTGVKTYSIGFLREGLGFGNIFSGYIILIAAGSKLRRLGCNLKNRIRNKSITFRHVS